MPFAIEDFTFYNLLSVAAPEIRGMWSFTEVPGTLQNDGTVDHSVSSTGICCMMMKTSRLKEDSWKFMSWWTGADVQTSYGQEIESQLGVSARYPSANIEAFSQMAWSIKEMNTLNSQWMNVKAIPEVPGGYFTSRHLNNAFRRVLSFNENPKETLLDYVNKINGEISAKRKEFRLDSK
jgi:ABC-type glycerol-3-phosphate transport system substrate-binding protein